MTYENWDVFEYLHLGRQSCFDVISAQSSGGTMKTVIAVTFFSRGVLYDIPRLKGVPYLEPGTRIFPEDLEAF
jgi:hypothetical protein